MPPRCLRDDQEIRQGRILVGVEVHDSQAGSRLAKASKILAETGATPISLPEG